MNGIMQLVLHGLEKQTSGPCILVVVESCSVEVRDLLIEFPLSQPDFTDVLELTLKVLDRKSVV